MKKIIMLILFISTISINIWILFNFNNEESSKRENQYKSVFNNQATIFLSDNKNLMSFLNQDKERKFQECLSKLSIADNYKIKEGLNSYEEDKIINSFQLMNHRLSKEDYEIIREIFYDLIDMDMIERQFNYKN